MHAARHQGGEKGSDYTLMQFHGTHCAGGNYVCLSLTLGSFTRKNLPDGHLPPVLCDKLTKNDDDGNFEIDSCPGSDEDGCPVDKCKNCTEDAVRHFALDLCQGGYMLKAGKPEDIGGCISTDRVDLGLARWCDRWPTSKHEIKQDLGHIVGSIGGAKEEGGHGDFHDDEEGDSTNKLIGISCENVTVGFNGSSAYDKMKSAMSKYREKAKIEED